jgi:uncharacterized protein YegL
MVDSLKYGRRLPVYVLIDCSDAVEAKQQALEALVAHASSDPTALETMWLSVITFDSFATPIVPLAELPSFRVPAIKPGKGASLGAALELLMQSIDREVYAGTATAKGDYRPLALIITDGFPTDRWEGPAEALKKRGAIRIVGCTTGSNVDLPVLKGLADCIVPVENIPSVLSESLTFYGVSVTEPTRRIDDPADV